MSRNDLTPRRGTVAARGRDLVVNGDIVLPRPDVLRALGIDEVVSPTGRRCVSTAPLPFHELPSDPWRAQRDIEAEGQRAIRAAPPRTEGHVLMPAVRLADGGRVLPVLTPGDDDAIRRAILNNGFHPHPDDEPGFTVAVHDDWRFAPRDEAFRIALAAGQLKPGATGPYLYWSDLCDV